MSAGMEMSAEEFEMHVAEALDEIPAELAALIDNCVILVEDYPPPRPAGHAGALLRHSTHRARGVLHRAA